MHSMMTSSRAFAPLLLCAALIAFACKDLGSPLTQRAAAGSLSGLVNDGQGNPLPGVGVHYIFLTLPVRAPAKVTGAAPNITIEFTLAHDGHVTLRLLRWYTRQSAATLIDTMLNAGNHIVVVAPSAFTNGVYIAQLNADNVLSEFPIIVQNPDPTSLVNTSPLAITDSTGRFTIPYGVFAFGLPVRVTAPATGVIDSVLISTSIQIVLFKNGYQILLQPVVIDTTESMSSVFVLRGS